MRVLVKHTDPRHGPPALLVNGHRVPPGESVELEFDGKTGSISLVEVEPPKEKSKSEAKEDSKE